MIQSSGEPVGIGEFLRRSKFLVPANQRTYAWKPPEIDELFDDLRSYLDTGDYFLGWIVLSAPTDGEAPTIIDGQQRLATFCMIYAAMRDYLCQNQRSDVARKIADRVLYTEPEWTSEKEPRLLMSSEDQAFFANHVVAPPDAEERKASRVSATSPHSHRRIAKAFERVREQVEHIAEGGPDKALRQLQRWDTYIRTRAKIIPLYVSDDLSAFQIFETLNDRGVELATADLLKNYLFRLAGIRRLDEAKALWSRAIGRIVSESRETIVTTFVHHFWSSKHGLTRERLLYKEIRRSIQSREDALAMLSDLDASSANYAAILHSDADVWKPLGVEGRELVGTLLKLKFEQYKPLLLACLDVFDHSRSEELRKLLRLLVGWAVRFQVTNQLGSSKLETFYPEAAAKVRKLRLSTASALVREVGTTVPSDEVFRRDFAKFEEDNAIAARYLLATINDYLERQEGKEEHDASRQLTLEHILPKADNVPDGMLFSKEVAPAYRFRLGNQTLLVRKANQSLGASGFAKKLKAYGESALPLTAQVAKYKKWTPEALEERQQWMADKAVRIWAARV